MHIYFSGIGGAGLGPLAQLALDCGYDVSGSDVSESPFTKELTARGVTIKIGEQTKEQILAAHTEQAIDWFVYTAALPHDHQELQFANEDPRIRITKRDELINQITEDKHLQLLVVSGTHGKTTSSAMLVWLFKQFNIPVSYQLGTTIGWGPSAKYQPESQFFVYEADEYDRNMLHFHPRLSIIPALDYDHPDTYPTQADYDQAFRDFAEQSQSVFTWQSIADKTRLLDVRSFRDDIDLSSIELPGEHNRRNAFLVIQAFHQTISHIAKQDLIPAINSFPGTHRRFEKLADNLYTDYAHHPTEIKAAIQTAKELNENVVVVYQPHQNKRQEAVKDQYKDTFTGAEKIYWLPTYEPSGRDATSTASAIFQDVPNAQAASLDNVLKSAINDHLSQNQLVLCLSAGTLDSWLRTNSI